MGSPGLQTAAAAEAAALAEESEAPKPKMQLGADRAWHVGCLEQSYVAKPMVSRGK